jgi:hypothetical protein
MAFPVPSRLMKFRIGDVWWKTARDIRHLPTSSIMDRGTVSLYESRCFETMRLETQEIDTMNVTRAIMVPRSKYDVPCLSIVMKSSGQAFMDAASIDMWTPDDEKLPKEYAEWMNEAQRLFGIASSSSAASKGRVFMSGPRRAATTAALMVYILELVRFYVDQTNDADEILDGRLQRDLANRYDTFKEKYIL